MFLDSEKKQEHWEDRRTFQIYTQQSWELNPPAWSCEATAFIVGFPLRNVLTIMVCPLPGKINPLLCQEWAPKVSTKGFKPTTLPRNKCHGESSERGVPFVSRFVYGEGHSNL